MPTRPDYITPEDWLFIERARLTRRWGVLNVYTCEACRLPLVTTDVDEGVTPFTTRCSSPHCDGFAVSAMYRVDPRAKLTPTHAWYRPETLDVAGGHADVEDHLRRGGLLLRELTPEERAILVGEPVMLEPAIAINEEVRP